METDSLERTRRYEAAMQEGALRYADVLIRLDAEGLAAIFTQTGVPRTPTWQCRSPIFVPSLRR